MGAKLSFDEINKKLPNNSLLKVIGESEEKYTYPNHKPERKLILLCQCGALTFGRLQHIISGRMISCGCKKSNDIILRNTKFPYNVLEINLAYLGIIERCYDSSYKNFHNYGGRGVRICDEWKNDYMKFLDWSLQNGWRKGLHIDKDLKGDGLLYSPETCCWIEASINKGYTRRTSEKVKKQLLLKANLI